MQLDGIAVSAEDQFRETRLRRDAACPVAVTWPAATGPAMTGPAAWLVAVAVLPATALPAMMASPASGSAAAYQQRPLWRGEPESVGKPSH